MLLLSHARLLSMPSLVAVLMAAQFAIASDGVGVSSYLDAVAIQACV